MTQHGETDVVSGDPMYWASALVDESPVVRAITADGVPLKPPSDWFVQPKLDGPTPLVVQSDGRVYGHIACWGTKHIGMPGAVKPPRSKSNYAFFATGAVETAEGQMVNVGQITLVGGHAPINASVSDAVAHYDNTESGMCDVAIGEDKHGIWVAGALRPSVDEQKIRQLRASAVSGDWRPINGNLELVAVCSVNVPGFPIPRARVASGQPLALVAAGVEPLVEERIRQIAAVSTTEALEAISNRVSRVEQYILASLAVDTDVPAADVAASIEGLENTIEAVETAIAENDGASVVDESKLNELRRRVRGDRKTVEAETSIDDRRAELRSRVHGKEVLPDPFPMAAAATLRERVHGPRLASLRARAYGTPTAITAAFGKGAAGKFDPSLHPRGKDGKFIEKFGWVNILDMGGKKRRGQVVGIKKGKDGKPVISVKSGDGKVQDVKPNAVESAPATKADLKRSTKPDAKAGFVIDPENGHVKKNGTVIGKVENADGQNYKATDIDGNDVGTFKSEQEAAQALSAARPDAGASMPETERVSPGGDTAAPDAAKPSRNDAAAAKARAATDPFDSPPPLTDDAFASLEEAARNVSKGSSRKSFNGQMRRDNQDLWDQLSKEDRDSLWATYQEASKPKLKDFSDDEIDDIRGLIDDLDMEDLLDSEVGRLVDDIEVQMLDNNASSQDRSDFANQLRDMANRVDNGDAEQGDMDLAPTLRQWADRFDEIAGGGNSGTVQTMDETKPFTKPPETSTFSKQDEINAIWAKQKVDDFGKSMDPADQDRLIQLLEEKQAEVGLGGMSDSTDLKVLKEEQAKRNGGDNAGPTERSDLLDTADRVTMTQDEFDGLMELSYDDDNPEIMNVLDNISDERDEVNGTVTISREDWDTIMSVAPEDDETMNFIDSIDLKAAPDGAAGDSVSDLWDTFNNDFDEGFSFDAATSELFSSSIDAIDDPDGDPNGQARELEVALQSGRKGARAWDPATVAFAQRIKDALDKVRTDTNLGGDDGGSATPTGRGSYNAGVKPDTASSYGISEDGTIDQTKFGRPVTTDAVGETFNLQDLLDSEIEFTRSSGGRADGTYVKPLGDVVPGAPDGWTIGVWSNFDGEPGGFAGQDDYWNSTGVDIVDANGNEVFSQSFPTGTDENNENALLDAVAEWINTQMPEPGTPEATGDNGGGAAPKV